MLRRLQRLIGSFQTQLLALIAATGLAFFVVLQIVDTSIEMQRLRSERLEDSRIVAAVAARALEQGFDQKDFAEMRKVLSAVRNQKHIFHASLVDRELTFMLDELTTTLAPLPLSLQSQVQMRALKSGQTEQAFAPQGIEIAEPLVREGQILGSVTVWTSYPGLLRTSLSVMLPNLLAVLPVMAVALLLSLLLGRRVSAPVKALRQAVQKFADGDFEQKLEIGGFLEFSQLGEALSQLATKLKDNINQIYELAYVDRITQLPNREFFKGEVIRAIKRAERQGSSGALLFVDLDGFKRVNDTMGHEVGDRLLKMFSERVVNVVRANDMVAFGASREYALRGASTDKQIFARLGGDEFTVLLEDIHEETDAASVARRIIAATSEAFVIDGAEVNLGASIGIATYPHDGSDYHSILKSADMAMYQAKEEGKNTYRFYSDELNKHAARRLEVESDLRRALAREELELYFQPIVDCNGGAPVAAEALVRWNHPVKGVLDPGEFIRIAEKSGLVLPLGLWVLKAACERMKELSEAGFDLSITINISRNQFEQHDFAQRVLETISGCGTSARRIELEISEEVLVANQRRTMEHFRRLKRSGIRIAVDDFGTGHSNLAQLGRLRPDVVKIDRSFVELLQDAADDQGRRTTRAILALAKSLEYSTCAVGVETGAQLKFLRDAGCDRVQGYLFGPAMPLGDFLQWLSSHGQDEDQLGDGPRKVAAG
ncbi:MAG: EAL domain-containing protein [Nitratireductor sp.]|nr:EAL domain-containing protein [Nitratireductor sp.]